MYHFIAHSFCALLIPFLWFCICIPCCDNQLKTSLLPPKNDDDNKTMLQEKRLQVLCTEERILLMLYVMFCCCLLGCLIVLESVWECLRCVWSLWDFFFRRYVFHSKQKKTNTSIGIQDTSKQWQQQKNYETYISHAYIHAIPSMNVYYIALINAVNEQ